MFDPIVQVQQIYREYQSALLNNKYYGARLEKLKRYNTVIEIIIAAGATGSGLAGLALWQLELGTYQLQVGRYIWALISAASALLALAKPILKFADRIESYGKLFGEYAKAHSGLKFIVADIQVQGIILDEDVKAFKQIRSRIAESISLEDSHRDSILVDQLQKEVDKEAPIAHLWVPEVNLQNEFKTLTTDDQFVDVANTMQPYLIGRSPELQQLIKAIDPDDLRLQGNARKARQAINAWISRDDVTAANQQQWLNAISVAVKGN